MFFKKKNKLVEATETVKQDTITNKLLIYLKDGSVLGWEITDWPKNKHCIRSWISFVKWYTKESTPFFVMKAHNVQQNGMQYIWLHRELIKYFEINTANKTIDLSKDM